ncbi:MAG TPA: glycosyltransferase [Gammaproteobacteria bacterium]|nr:glycosyltransferase [Gammaproteobacteria bacterium]
MKRQGRLLLFAKPPLTGRVKTRLAARLGTIRATAVHRLLLEHALETARCAPCPAELWCAPPVAHPHLRSRARRLGLPLQRQRGRDLGARMAHAFRATLRHHRPALLMGSDCPLLEAGQLQQALAVLEAGRDAVLIPAEDGGYVLLGLRRHAPRLFRDMPWGGAEVLARTRLRLRQEGLWWEELPPLFDVDRPEDLGRLLETAAPAHSRLARLQWRLRALLGTPWTASGGPL